MGAECSQVGACSGGGARPSCMAPQPSIPAPSSAAGIACRSSPNRSAPLLARTASVYTISAKSAIAASRPERRICTCEAGGVGAGRRGGPWSAGQGQELHRKHSDPLGLNC